MEAYFYYKGEKKLMTIQNDDILRKHNFSLNFENSNYERQNYDNSSKKEILRYFLGEHLFSQQNRCNLIFMEAYFYHIEKNTIMTLNSK